MCPYLRFTLPVVKHHQTEAHQPPEVVVQFYGEFDYWKPQAMKLNVEEGYYEIYRMVPPGTTQYFFSTKQASWKDEDENVEEFCVAPDEPHQALERRVVGGRFNYQKTWMHDVARVNVVDVEPRTEILIQPRTKYRLEARENPDWFTQSVFYDFEQDTEDVLQQAFESDWNYSKVCRYTPFNLNSNSTYLFIIAIECFQDKSRRS